MSLGQDSGLSQDWLLSAERVERHAPVPGDAQLLVGGSSGWCVAAAEGSSVSEDKESSGLNH